MFQAARQGKLVPLVSLGTGRVPFFPAVTNLKELGYPYWCVIEYGLAARAGTPEVIRKRLEAAVEKAVGDQFVREKLIHMGLSPRFIDGATLKKLIVDATMSVQDLIRYNKALPGE